MSNKYIKPINDSIRKAFTQQADSPSKPPTFSGEGSVKKLSEVFDKLNRSEVRAELSKKAKQETKAKDWMTVKSSGDTMAQWEQSLRMRYRTRIANWRMCPPSKFQVVRALDKQEAILKTVGA